MATEYPVGYDRADGSVVGPEWAGRDIPIPPSWVRKFTDLPQGTEPATLSRELAFAFPEGAREECVRYVKAWPEVLQYGHHLLIVGTRSSWRVRQWAASGTVNEIVMRFGGVSDVSQHFVSLPFLRGMLPYKASRFDSFAAFRARLLSAKLLLVEDPLNMPRESEERWFVEDLYAIRAANKLPTITSFSSATADDVFLNVKNVLGTKTADLLEHHGRYMARF